MKTLIFSQRTSIAKCLVYCCIFFFWDHPLKSKQTYTKAWQLTIPGQICIPLGKLKDKAQVGAITPRITKFWVLKLVLYRDHKMDRLCCIPTLNLERMQQPDSRKKMRVAFQAVKRKPMKLLGQRHWLQKVPWVQGVDGTNTGGWYIETSQMGFQSWK